MLVVLTNYYFPEIGGCSTRITELTRELSGKVKITVLCPVPSYPFNKALGIFKHRYTSERINDNLEVVRIKVPVSSTSSLKGRFLSEIILVLFALKYFCQYLRKDCKWVLTTSPPFFINFFGLVCKTIFGIMWIQDIRDLWPDSIIGTGVAKENSITVRFLRSLEKLFYNKATKTVTVTEGMAGHIEGKLSICDRSKVSIIPNGCSEEMNRLAEKYIRLKKKQKSFDNEEIIVGYIGNLGRAQDLQLLVDLIKKAEDNNLINKKIKFMIAGEGAKKEWFKNHLTNIDNVVIRDGTNDIKKVAQYYSEIDIFIIPLKNEPVFETVIPSKVYEIISFKKPFIHFTKGELEKIGIITGLGVFCDRINLHDVFLKLSKTEDKTANNFRILGWKENSMLFFKELLN